MGEPLHFAPLRTPVTDPRTGLMSREWYLFFHALWLRSGGSSDGLSDDVYQGGIQGGMSGDVMALLGSISSEAAMTTAIADLQSQVADLRNEIDAAKQGPDLASLQSRVAELMNELDALKQGPVI